MSSAQYPPFSSSPTLPINGKTMGLMIYRMDAFNFVYHTFLQSYNPDPEYPDTSSSVRILARTDLLTVFIFIYLGIRTSLSLFMGTNE